MRFFNVLSDQPNFKYAQTEVLYKDPSVINQVFLLHLVTRRFKMVLAWLHCVPTTLRGRQLITDGGCSSPAADDTRLVLHSLHVVDGDVPIDHPHGQLTGVVGGEIQAGDGVVAVDESVGPLRKRTP